MPTCEAEKENFQHKKVYGQNIDVDKLSKVEFIREANYLVWISNVVLVKKANGSWKVCVDFTNLDTTVGHKLLSFMDVYLGFNQIPISS